MATKVKKKPIRIEKPAAPPGPKPEGLKEYTAAEWAERRARRKRGELEDKPAPALLPADAERARQRIYVTLDPHVVAIARKIGNGVVSRGLDRAVFHYDNHPPKRSKAHE